MMAAGAAAQLILLFAFAPAEAGRASVTMSDNGIAGAATAVPTFEEYVKAHSRTYLPGSDEHEQRRLIYQARVHSIEAHNRNENRLWTEGVNMMSDRTQEEMQAFNGYKKSPKKSSGGSSFLDDGSDGDTMPHDMGYSLPDQHNWMAVDIDGDKKDETVNALSNIRSQKCGNCWAACTNAMMESHLQLHTGKVSVFSDDTLTDCSENPFHCGGEGGCQGSTPSNAQMFYDKHGFFLRLAQQGNKSIGQIGLRGAAPQGPACPRKGGIFDMSQQGVHEIQDGVRQASENSPARKFGYLGWEKLPENRGEPIMRALYERGPVAVAVATGWSQYKSGVYGGCSKDSTIGHSVLAIGFGQLTFEGKVIKFWNLQNSWGPGFGENGHFRLLRHDRDDEYCGTDSDPKAGTGCDNGPTTVKICGMCGVLYDAVVPHFEAQTVAAKRMLEFRGLREAAAKGGAQSGSNTMAAMAAMGGAKFDAQFGSNTMAAMAA